MRRWLIMAGVLTLGCGNPDPRQCCHRPDAPPRLRGPPVHSLTPSESIV